MCPLATSNMMCFDPNNKLKKYEALEDILKVFYQIRLNFYVQRMVGYDFFFTIDTHTHICIAVMINIFLYMHTNSLIHLFIYLFMYVLVIFN